MIWLLYKCSVHMFLILLITFHIECDTVAIVNRLCLSLAKQKARRLSDAVRQIAGTRSSRANWRWITGTSQWLNFSIHLSQFWKHLDHVVYETSYANPHQHQHSTHTESYRAKHPPPQRAMNWLHFVNLSVFDCIHCSMLLEMIFCV